MSQPTLSTILSDYELYAQSRRLSPHTLADYQNTFRKLNLFLGDPLFCEIAKTQIEAFLAAQTVSKKTLLNYHTGLAALWTWAVKEGYTSTHLLHQVDRPRPERTKIIPFSDADIHALLSALTRSLPYKNHDATSTNALSNPERNRAIIYTLLDTGIRAEELCCLTIADLDTRNLRLHIAPAGAKGDKERYNPVSPRTAEIIRKYLTKIRPEAAKGDPLFVVEKGYPLTRGRLLQQLRCIGRRANVPDCHPHRFRHTFAINYLRNGGDPWSLQEILGHSSMDMVRNYLQLARSDISAAHRRASPVSNLRL